jgi:hypothetical protein
MVEVATVEVLQEKEAVLVECDILVKVPATKAFVLSGIENIHTENIIM